MLLRLSTMQVLVEKLESEGKLIALQVVEWDVMYCSKTLPGNRVEGETEVFKSPGGVLRMRCDTRQVHAQ